MNVHHHPITKRSTSESGSSSLAGGEPPSYDETMNHRLDKLEVFAADTSNRLASIEGRLIRIETTLEQTASKTDLAELRTELRTEMQRGFTDIIKWVVGTAIVMGGTAVTVMTFVLNYGTPRVQAPALMPQPLVIQLPASPSPAR